MTTDLRSSTGTFNHPRRVEAIALIEERMDDWICSDKARSYENPHGYIWNTLRVAYEVDPEHCIEQYCLFVLR